MHRESSTQTRQVPWREAALMGESLPVEGPGLQPLVAPGIELLIVGYNPSITAYRTGHYYAHHANRFYHLLFLSGLTPRLLKPQEDVLLPSFGIGMTDLSALPSVRANDLPQALFSRGTGPVMNLVRAFRPRVVCCNGLGVFRVLCERPAKGLTLQEGVSLEGVPVWVVPSSSGAASALTVQRAAAWRALGRYLGRNVPED